MIACKNCQSKSTTKNGRVRGKQRFRCKSCGYAFVQGDGRTRRRTDALRATAILFYGTARASYRSIAKILGVTHRTVQVWVEREAEKMPDLQVPAQVREMEFDEMWHFVGSKKTKYGSSRPWNVLHGELSPGLLAIVILKRSENCT